MFPFSRRDPSVSEEPLPQQRSSVLIPTGLPGGTTAIVSSLVQSFDERTVELYGDAAVEALEQQEAPDVAELFAPIEPLVTVDLADFADDAETPSGKQLQHASDPSADAEPPETDEETTWDTIEEVTESNDRILALKVDEDTEESA